MEESQSKAVAPAPFLTKTYEMVDDPQTNYLVSWSDNGCSFVVWNPPEFSKELLPQYFKHNNFSSFVRQLNTYGFRKVDPDQWEFSNEEFLRGDKHLLKNIYRRKPSQSHSMQNVPLGDSERQMYEDEIKRLQHENSFLHSELQKQRGGNSLGVDFQVQFLGKRLHEMESKQMQTVTFLLELMRNPRFPSAVADKSDDRGKRRRLLELDQSELDNALIANENAPMLDLNSVEKLQSSLNTLDEFLHGVGQKITEEENDIGSSATRPPPLVIPANRESSGDSERNIHTWSPRSAPSSSSKDFRSMSPDLGASLNQVDSPTTSSVYIDVDISLKSSVIDVNAEPSSNNNASEIEKTLEEQEREKIPGAPAEMNDVFWEQFLTETPRPSDSQEVQSESTDGNDTGNKPARNGKFWWNAHYDIDFIKQFGSQMVEETKTT